MALEEKEHVDGLCKQMCIEQDQQRLTALVAELNKLLAIKEHLPSPAPPKSTAQAQVTTLGSFGRFVAGFRR